MARITVEDCIVRIPNRFALVVLAARRARELGTGIPPAVAPENDKNHVIALRELADGAIEPGMIIEALTMEIRGIEDDDTPPEDATWGEGELIAPDDLDWAHVMRDPDRPNSASDPWYAAEEDEG